VVVAVEFFSADEAKTSLIRFAFAIALIDFEHLLCMRFADCRIGKVHTSKSEPATEIAVALVSAEALSPVPPRSIVSLIATFITSTVLSECAPIHTQ
jgi:hypothetical protein